MTILAAWREVNSRAIKSVLKSCGFTAHTAKIPALEVDEPEDIIQDIKEVGRTSGFCRAKS
jgi:hypothetical protein